MSSSSEDVTTTMAEVLYPHQMLHSTAGPSSHRQIPHWGESSSFASPGAYETHYSDSYFVNQQSSDTQNPSQMAQHGQLRNHIPHSGQSTQLPGVETYSSYASSAFSTPSRSSSFSTRPSQPLGAPPFLNSYVPIAPDPAGAHRMRSMSNAEEPMHTGRRRRRFLLSPSEQPGMLKDEEKFLLQLKDEQNLPWKEIATKFQTDLGQAHQIPALQMRYKRLKERLRVWTEADVSALRQAHEYWENKKWEIISEKMLEYGVTERFPAKSCARQWHELYPGEIGQQSPFSLNETAGSPLSTQSYTPSTYQGNILWQ